MQSWWETFFDNDYIRVWGGRLSAARSEEEAEGIWQLLQLHAGSRLLDAPCGYGRLSRPLAERGAEVVAVDQSAALLAQAENDRGALPPSRLRYLRHDLRRPLDETGFDAAINVFSSLGYGTEDDDLAILATLRSAVRPGGLVLVETMHRDSAVTCFARGSIPASRLPDGTLVVEEPSFDAITGRVNTKWFWSGPGGQGVKTASFRVYSATELVALLRRAGLCFLSAHKCCSTVPFKAEGGDMGGRLVLLAAVTRS